MKQHETTLFSSIDSHKSLIIQICRLQHTKQFRVITYSQTPRCGYLSTFECERAIHGHQFRRSVFGKITILRNCLRCKLRQQIFRDSRYRTMESSPCINTLALPYFTYTPQQTSSLRYHPTAIIHISFLRPRTRLLHKSV